MAAAKEEAERRGLANTTEFIHNDFLAVASETPIATVVTLDRVISCYSRHAMLLEAALKHTGRCVALSYPKDRWYVRLVTAIDNGRRRLGSNPFRTFVHRAASIEEVIRRAGFTLSSRRETLIWSVDLYLKGPT